MHKKVGKSTKSILVISILLILICFALYVVPTLADFRNTYTYSGGTLTTGTFPLTLSASPKRAVKIATDSNADTEQGSSEENMNTATGSNADYSHENGPETDAD